MSKKHFILNKESPWYIYGYTEKGIWLFDKLRQDDCNVKGFIDRNADVYENDTEEIISTNELNIPHESIIIISCQTINTQLSVAKSLSKQGYNNLIYMAAGKEFQKECALSMRQTYEKIFKEGILNYGSAVYKYNVILNTSGRGKTKSEFGDRDIVVVKVPIELLYTKTISRAEKESFFRYSGKIQQLIREASDKPISIVQDINSLFELALKGEDDAIESFQSYVSTYAYFGERDYNSFINDRIATLKIWQDELECGMEYFIDAAATVEWNEKGYFNVIDGVHRSLFLYHSGFRYIPVTMTKLDYQKYCNLEVKQELMRMLKERDIYDWENYFYEYFQTKLMIHIFKYLSSNSLPKEGFLDIQSNTGYFACMAYKFGFSRVGSISECSNLVKKNAEFLYVNDLQCFDEDTIEKIENAYNVIIVSDACSDSLLEKIIRYKEESANVTLFMTQDYEQRDSFEIKAETLCSYLGEGKVKKLVVF